MTEAVSHLDRLEETQARAVLRDFLTSYPLYRKLRLRLKTGVVRPELPTAISQPCKNPSCRNEPATSWSRGTWTSPGGLAGSFVRYTCVHCGQETQDYWLIEQPRESAGPNLPIPAFIVFDIHKIGQWPAWSIAVPKEMQRALGDTERELYQNALVCMSQSYGLGALSYFRRILENTIGSLLDLVEESAVAENDERALEAVRQARLSRVADDKLRLIRQFVPASLRPGGVNPFAKLYDDYSRGIHSLSDEQCLAVASELRDALEYVFGNIRERLEQAKVYRAKITKKPV